MATKATKTTVKNQDNAESNRMKRLQRTLKAQPNNLQVQAALKTTRMHRKTPTNAVWSHSWRRVAQLIRSVSGRFDPACMSSNPESARNAMARQGPATAVYKELKFVSTVMAPAPFSLGARIHSGAASWN
jgi:hypothetical protein